jgi:hypothetical protein
MSGTYLRSISNTKGSNRNWAKAASWGLVWMSDRGGRILCRNGTPFFEHFAGQRLHCFW